MRSKTSLKWSVLFISFAAVILSTIIIYFLSLNPLAPGSYAAEQSPLNDTLSGKQTEFLTPPENFGLPVRLVITKINVDAKIESVGLTPDGAVDVPKDPTNAAWFNLGPLPGETGSSVIDGHYGWWKDGTQAVFNNLSSLHKGDRLYVKDAAGTTITFMVRESRKYDPKANDADVFNSSDGKSHLNLITCSGTWNNIQKKYSDRLVIFTDRVIE